MKRINKVVLILGIVFLMSSSVVSVGVADSVDIDPLVDLEVTVDVLKIRSLEHYDPQLSLREIIDVNSDPDFYVKVIINGEVFTSDTLWDTRYIYDTFFSATLNVPDDVQMVDVVIQLWDAADGWDIEDRMCDIGPDSGSYDAQVSYDLKTGHWTGDDYVGDSSGYGRLNGCDDGTIYEKDRDCELWFDIGFNDYDSDGIPYDMEVNDYGTDPEEDDSQIDYDSDCVSTFWEFRYGYDPMVYDNHLELDTDVDGIKNIYEFYTWQWFSDPFTPDLFVELDQMEEGPNGELSIFPEMSKEMLYTAYDRQNVVYHLDDGRWGEESGSEFIPFDESTTVPELYDIQNEYFYNNSPQPWRKYVFHYGVLIWESSYVAGMAFNRNAYQISANLVDGKIEKNGYDTEIAYAGVYMHEMGHNLNLNPLPGHGKFGWLLRIIFPVYKSVMSYGYVYRMVDYSDGSRGFYNKYLGDYDDWERMDLPGFLRAVE